MLILLNSTLLNSSIRSTIILNSVNSIITSRAYVTDSDSDSKSTTPKKKITKKIKDSIKNLIILPTEYEICEDYLLEKFGGNYIFDNGINQWYKYDAGGSNIWEAITEEDLKFNIIKYLKEHEAIGKKIKLSYLKNVIDFLRTLLKINFREFSNQHINLIPFNNGILNIITGELLPHSSEFKFTSKLNINYIPEAKMSKDFANWLLFISNHNPQFLDVLRSYIYLIFTRNNKLQIALYLWGPAGTGKSTFEKLMVSIVSREGTVSTDLKRLKSNFETAKLINKNLLLLSDIDDSRSDVNKIKLIISGDMLAAERKFEQPFEFFPTCLVLISSNHIWQPTDTSSGIMRRIVYLNFNNIPDSRNPDLFYLDINSNPRGILAESLPGFINWILANPIEKLELFSKDISILNESLSPLAQRDTNPLLFWASSNLIYKEGAGTFIGNKKSPSSSHLYPNYLNFCSEFNFTPISFHKFGYSLQDLCLNSLNWKGVIKKELHQGVIITNIIINPEPVSISPTIKADSYINLEYFNGFVEGLKGPNFNFKGLSNYPINPYALKPGSSLKNLSEYSVNPYALTPTSSGSKLKVVNSTEENFEDPSLDLKEEFTD